MPYSSNSELPPAVRSRYSDHCQSVFRHTWNSEYDAHGDEARAFATAHASAKRCQGSGKAMSGAAFKVFIPQMRASLGDDNKMRLHGVASSTIKDRHGDTMTMSALADMEKAANAGLTIFLNHSYVVPEDIAGTVERAYIRPTADPDVHDLAFDVVMNDANPRAVDAWKAINNSGTKLGLSIGAMIPEGGAKRDRASGAFTIDHVELLETSLVGVPANPRSWIEYAVKSLRKAEEALAGGSTNKYFGVDGTEEIIDETGEPDEVEETITVPEVLEVEPDITDATVQVETPFANITVDTGNRGGGSHAAAPAGEEATSQEAAVEASAPESEEATEDQHAENPWAQVINHSVEPDEAEVRAALAILEPTVLASLRSSNDLLRAITSELIDTRKRLELAESDRDRATAMAAAVVEQSTEILQGISKLPIGRRTSVVAIEQAQTTLAEVYSKEFLALLNKKD